ncbi:MAG TPA: hypothetical protein VK284_09425 [Streptosporangiaceae bacterium]|nr:hypothetical protein [Streptosporangiaceae bacterium]
METGNQEGPAPRVSFGPKEYQTLNLEVASMVLTLWRERQPATFGAYLAEVMTGTRPAASRNRRPQQ